MDIQHMIDAIRNPKMPRPNPVLALRENLGAPRHERGQPRKSKHVMLRLNADILLSSQDRANMAIEAEALTTEMLRKRLPVSERESKDWAVSNGIVMPYKYSSKRHAIDDFRYDRVPMFGDVLGIPAKDIHQLGFLAMQEGRWKAEEFCSVGWKVLGSGCYSTAFVHQDNTKVVAKVCWKGDLTMLWLRYCLNNKGKAGCPNVHAIYKLGEGYIVLLDRLIKDQESVDNAEEFLLITKYIECVGRDNIENRQNMLRDEARDKFYKEQGIQEFDKRDELYAVFACFVASLADDVWRFDFHNENAMYTYATSTTDRCFVITDPLTE